VEAGKKAMEEEKQRQPVADTSEKYLTGPPYGQLFFCCHVCFADV
jgi:hypothetical protein